MRCLLRSHDGTVEFIQFSCLKRDEAEEVPLNLRGALGKDALSVEKLNIHYHWEAWGSNLCVFLSD